MVSWGEDGRVIIAQARRIAKGLKVANSNSAQRVTYCRQLLSGLGSDPGLLALSDLLANKCRALSIRDQLTPARSRGIDLRPASAGSNARVAEASLGEERKDASRSLGHGTGAKLPDA